MPKVQVNASAKYKLYSKKTGIPKYMLVPFQAREVLPSIQESMLQALYKTAE